VISGQRRPGLLVTLDGPGGSGKSTVANLLADRFRAAGLPVLATTEPTRTELGNLIRNGTDRYRGLALAYLVAADRHDHLETEIRPALERGRTVVCDRYVASSLVLQRMDGVDEQTIWDLARGVDAPDVAVILTAQPGLLAERIAARGAHSRWERDPSSSATEVALYAVAGDALRARGVYVLAMDSSTTAAEAIADRLAELVRVLAERRRDNPSSRA
jgi:dTMP kinase